MCCFGKKRVTLSEFFKGVTENLNKLKEPVFSKEELERRGITSSFQNFPCVFDICRTKEGWFKHETTRIKSSLKHILTSKCSSQDKELAVQETYLTYVDVGIEHYEKLAKWLSVIGKIVCWVLAVVVVLLVSVGTVALVNKFSSSKQSVEISQSVVRLLNGTTNLAQKVEMSVKCEDRGK